MAAAVGGWRSVRLHGRGAGAGADPAVAGAGERHGGRGSGGTGSRGAATAGTLYAIGRGGAAVVGRSWAQRGAGRVGAAGGAVHLSHLGGGLALVGAVQGSGHRGVLCGAHIIIRTTSAHVVRFLQEVVAGNRVVSGAHGGVVIGRTLENHSTVDANRITERETRRGRHRGVTGGHIGSIGTRHGCQIEILLALKSDRENNMIQRTQNIKYYFRRLIPWDQLES